MQLGDVTQLDLRPEALTRPVPQRFRIGLIGAGRIVHSSVMPAYRAAGLSPVAAADPDPAARARLQEHWGIAQVFEDYGEMLDAVQLDVVDINIRWDVGLSATRVDAVARAAQRGMHVIIAKPLAETWEQCQAMVAQAREGRVKLAVDQNLRYAPAFFGCGVLIRESALGPLISASVNYHSAIGRQHSNAFDAAHDNVVHAVDVLRTWFGETPVEVFAHWSRRVDGVGSVYAATLIFESGANATILYDFATRHRRRFEFIAVGEAASADGLEDYGLPAPARLRRATLRYGPHQDRGLTLELPLLYALSPTSYLATRADLLQSIEDDRQPWSSGEDNLQTMRILFALEESIRGGRAVRLADLSPDSAWDPVGGKARG